MNLAKTIITLLLCCCITTSAQTADYNSWQARLNDDTPIAALSLPGAHDAATGEGLHCIAGFGKTQELTLAEQWDCGVRAFDLRPAIDSTTLHIYHGIIKTRITFDKAISIITGKLREQPTEFAIVLLREESDSENDKEKALWPRAIGECIAALGDTAAYFSPTMTVADLRGKILFLSRDRYTGTDKGATITGWNHSAQGTKTATVSAHAGNAQLQVQDYYNTTSRQRQQAKANAILRFIELANKATPATWTINFLSAYSNTWMRITPFATTAGYKRNACTQHPTVVASLTAQEHHRRHTGILFMDYAGTEYAPAGLWHWSRFCTQGKTLVELIIEQNFTNGNLPDNR